MSRSTLWRFLAIALPALGALVASLPSVDLTYQLRAGAEILDHGAIPSVDSWTFTVAGTPCGRPLLPAAEVLLVVDLQLTDVFLELAEVFVDCRHNG